MKLNDFKERKNVNEGVISAHLGKWADQLRGKASGQTSVKDRLAKENFMNSFVGKAVSALQAAIDGGTVDPNAKATRPKAAKPTATPTAAPGATPTVVPAPAASPKVAPTAPTAPTAAPKVAPTKAPTKAPAVALKVAPNVAQRTANMQQKRKEKEIAYARNKHIQDYGGANESKYAKLNSIFESMILNEAGESISSFLQGWFTQFMHGVNYAGREKVVDSLIAAVQAAYVQDNNKLGRNVKNALTKLASTGYALSYSASAQKTAPTAAATAPTAAAATAPTAAPSQMVQNISKMVSSTNSVELRKIIRTALSALKKADLKAYTDFITKLRSAQQPAKPAVTTTPTAATPGFNKPAATAIPKAATLPESRRPYRK